MAATEYAQYGVITRACIDMHFLILALSRAHSSAGVIHPNSVKALSMPGTAQNKNPDA